MRPAAETAESRKVSGLAPGGTAEVNYEDESWAVFQAFNRSVGFGQPSLYPVYAALREESAVHPGMPHLGLPGNPEAGPQTFSVYGYDAAAEVLLDPATYSSAVWSDYLGSIIGRTVIEMDPPDHRAYRMLLQKSLSPKSMEGWKRNLVEPLLAEMTARIRPAGKADILSGLLFAFPMRTFASMLGLPDRLFPVFHHRAIKLITLSAEPEKGREVIDELGGMFAEVLEARRREPRDDLLSVLAQAEHDGQRLTDEEIFSFLRLLLPAGAETTYRSSSSLLLCLLTQPDQFDLVKRDPGLLPTAVNEAFRLEAPLQFVPRGVTRDTELAGVPVPAGSTVIVNLGAANHDPARWEDPDRFDLSRPYQQYLSFGYGPHLCIGMHLAKMETESLVRALVRDLPNLRLDPALDPPQIGGTLMRSPERLDVVWDA
jgi:cytochrome P450